MENNVKPLSSGAKVALQCVEDSNRWWPDQTPTVPFVSLCLAGEVGEICNVVKKIERGSLSFEDPHTRYLLHMELADAYTYLHLLFGLLRVDPEAAYKMKRTENERRFGGKHE